MSNNAVRVVVAGVIAGVIRLVGNGIERALILGPMFDEEIRRNHPALIPSMETTSSKLGFTILNLLMGITMLYVYAAMRPRFASRAATAFRAAVPIWFIASLNWAVTALMGLFSWRQIVVEAAITLIPVLVGIFAGAALYPEPDDTGGLATTRLASAGGLR